MKKFFSLLCATLLVFSASAAPVAKKAEIAKKAVAVEQVQKVQFEKAQTLNINQLSATPALKVSNQKAEAPAILGKKVVKANHNATPAVSVAPAKAPAAVAEDVNVTAITWRYDDYYYDVYLQSENDVYLIELLETTGGLTYGTTYTYADMYADWVCTLDEEGYPLVKATDATLTVTKDQDGLIHIAATMVLEGVKHVISYDEKPFVPSGVQIPLNGTELTGKYNSYYYFYLYTAKVGENTIQLAFDATAEQATYTKDQVLTDYCVYYSDDYSTYVEFVKAASDFTVTTTETTKTLAGSLYADNGDEYILNLVYEKPDAKEITLVADTLNFFTKMLSAGYYQMQGYTVDSTYAFSFYFISKSLSGNYTEEDMDAYSTWVDQKDGKKTVVSYQNLSAANIKASLVNDTLYYTGTMTLATNDGQEANITLNLSCPYKQEWGEWADFAPFDLNTGKYYFNLFGQTQAKAAVQVRKDNTGLKQYKITNWGANMFTANGVELIINVDADNVCTLKPTYTGYPQDPYYAITDYYTFTGSAQGSSTFDPENGKFTFKAVYFNGNTGQGLYSVTDSLVMDQPILERDTVKVTADMKIAAEPTKGIIKVSAELNDTTFILEVVGADTVGTFSLADGTLSQKYYYGIASDAGRSDFAEGEVTIAKNETGLKLNGLMIGVDEKAYVLDWTYTPITERDTVKVNLEAITVQEDVNSTTQAHRGWLFVGIDTETRYIVQVLGTEQLGTFSYANGTLGSNYYNVIALDGSSKQQFTEGEVTIVEDAEGLKLTGLLIGEDEKAYALNWIQPAGRLQYDTDAPFDATFAYSDMSADLDEGVIGIYATNAEGLTIGLELYADPAATKIPEGVYTISDSQEAGTALQSLGVAGGYLTECWAGTRAASGGIDDCWFLVEGTITLSYDEYGKLKVVVDAKNSYGQPVTALIAYEKIEPKKTVDFTDAELYVYDGYVEKYGIMNFYGGNADGYKFDLYAYADTIAGDFLEAIDFGDCELTSPAGSIGIIDAYEFKVEADGKNLTLTAKVLGSDTVQYNITATGYLGYIQGDAVEGYVGEFAMENVTLLQATKSQVMINGFNEVGDTVAIVFDAKFSKTAGTIVEPQAGEYDVIMASTGFTAEYDVNPSFVGNNAGVWFIQSGKLIIAEDGSMAFAGVNSYDAPVAIGFTVPTPEVTDYYLVGWINDAAYGIEGDIDNFGDYHFVDGKVKATFDVLSYVQVKDNNKLIYGTTAYVAPAESGNATLVANGPEKVAINGGAEYEYTLVVNEDGTLTLSYEVVTVGLRNPKANVKAAKRVANGQIVIVRENKEYNILGAAL